MQSGKPSLDKKHRLTPPGAHLTLITVSVFSSHTFRQILRHPRTLEYNTRESQVSQFRALTNPVALLLVVGPDLSIPHTIDHLDHKPSL